MVLTAAWLWIDWLLMKDAEISKNLFGPWFVPLYSALRLLTLRRVLGVLGILM